MSDPIRFLVSFGQAVSTMALYNDGHPARERAVDRSYSCLRDLQQHDPHPRFSFLGEETIYQETALRELGDWEWGTRLAQAGVQRIELDTNVTREQYEEFLEEMMARTAYGEKRERPRKPSTLPRPLPRSRTRSAKKPHRFNRCTRRYRSEASCLWPRLKPWCAPSRWRCTAIRR